jgi:uracil DNA glycosylase
MRHKVDDTCIIVGRSQWIFDSKPFSQINDALREAGRGEIDWQIPDL